MLNPWAKARVLPSVSLSLMLVVVDAALVLVGREDHDDVGPLGGVGDALDLEAVLLRLGGRLGAVLEGDGDLDAGVAEVLGVGVALRAVADDRDLLALDERQVGVGVVEDLGHGGVFLLVYGFCEIWVQPRRTRSVMLLPPRPMASRPDCASSLMPKGSSARSKASTLPLSPVTSITRASGA